jgi:hypothetical protein
MYSFVTGPSAMDLNRDARHGIHLTGDRKEKWAVYKVQMEDTIRD